MTDSDAPLTASADISLLSTLSGLHDGAGVCAMDVRGPLVLTAGEDSTLSLTLLPAFAAAATTDAPAATAGGSAGGADALLASAGGATGRVLGLWDHCAHSLPTTVTPFPASSPSSSFSAAPAAAQAAPLLRATLGVGLPARAVRFVSPHAAVSAGAGGRVLRWDFTPLVTSLVTSFATSRAAPSAASEGVGAVGSTWGPVSVLNAAPLLPVLPLPSLGLGVPTVTSLAPLPASYSAPAASAAAEAELVALAGGCGDGAISLWLPALGRDAAALIPAAADAAAAAGAAGGAGAVTDVAFVPWDTTQLLYCTANGYIGVYYVTFPGAGAASSTAGAGSRGHLSPLGGRSRSAAAAAAAAATAAAASAGGRNGVSVEFAGLLLGDPAAGAGATAGGLPVGRLDFDSATQHVVVNTGQGKVVHFALPAAARR